MTVAALFVETDGCYFGLPNVDPWDITRDARTYAGPSPVIAHPPCERWGRFAEGSPLKKTYRAGDDDGCFESAIAAVRKFGGILEHPAHSKAWKQFDLTPPAEGGWNLCGKELTGIVEQGHYGHPARKRTWLLLVGNMYPRELIWGPSPQRLPQRRLAERGYESARRCGAVGNMSHAQRQRTPPAFRDLLISLAESCA